LQLGTEITGPIERLLQSLLVADALLIFGVGA
jgi:hypothetical protein